MIIVSSIDESPMSQKVAPSAGGKRKETTDISPGKAPDEQPAAKKRRTVKPREERSNPKIPEV